MKKYWISKYVLSRGIYAVEGEVDELNGKRVCTTREYIGRKFSTCYYKPDWHETEREAKDQAKIMIERKLVSIRTQNGKLLKLLTELK